MFGDGRAILGFGVVRAIVAVLGLVLEAEGEATLARRQDHMTEFLVAVVAPRLSLFFGMRFFGGRQYFTHRCV